MNIDDYTNSLIENKRESIKEATDSDSVASTLYH